MTKTERPILMNAFSVKAILAGRKTQTRRVIKPQPIINEHGFVVGPGKWTPQGIYIWSVQQWQEIVARYHCPYGWTGNCLWVRETWATSALFDDLKPSLIDPDDTSLWYRAGKPNHVLPSDIRGRWRSSIFMPRWVSHITLEVTDIRAERVQDITDKDAWAEGAWWYRYDDAAGPPLYVADGEHINCFRELWDSINAKRGYSWDTNCWVWVVEFERYE